MRMLVTAILALCGATSLAHAQSTQGPPAVHVGVVTAERKPVTKSLDFVGLAVGSFSTNRGGLLAG
jgi:hypothetical protein